MRENRPRKSVALGALLSFAATAQAQTQPTPTPDWDAELRSAHKEVSALAQTDVWGDIPWRWCLLEASQEGRAQNKPLFMYAIAGDPVGRC